jgi:hypothetical protein
MHADLVGSSGDRAKFHQAPPVADGDSTPSGDGFLPARVDNHPPAGLDARALGERQVDDALRLGDFAGDDSQIIFLHLASFERPLQRRAGARVASEMRVLLIEDEPTTAKASS